jgi:hypothetical protein
MISGRPPCADATTAQPAAAASMAALGRGSGAVGRDGDHVGRPVDGVDVGDEAGDLQPVADAELPGERYDPFQSFLGARPRLSGEQPDDAAIP